MFHISVPRKEFAKSIAETSEGTYEKAGDTYIVHGEQIVIDLDACAKAVRVGHRLTPQEQDLLLSRHIRQPAVHVYRMGNKVYITKASGMSKCEVRLPMKMMDDLKKNAIIRNKTLTQLFAEMADYYLLTFGEATSDVHEYIRERQNDLQYQSGLKPELGIKDDKRNRHPNDWPDYPRSMNIDK